MCHPMEGVGGNSRNTSQRSVGILLPRTPLVADLFFLAFTASREGAFPVRFVLTLFMR